MHIALFFKSVNERCFCTAGSGSCSGSLVRQDLPGDAYNLIGFCRRHTICCCWLRGRTSGPFRPQFIVRFCLLCVCFEYLFATNSTIFHWFWFDSAWPWNILFLRVEWVKKKASQQEKYVKNSLNQKYPIRWYEQGIKPEPKQEIKSRTTCNLREGLSR